MKNTFKRAWVEINLDNIEHNINELKRLISRDVKLMAVVKADAYGHGFLETSKALLSGGADYLAVSFLDEAKQIRNHGIDAKLLILGYTAPKYADEIVDRCIIQTVYDYDVARAISVAAMKMNKKAKIHIKVDTGMSRIGFMINEEAIDTIINIAKLPMIDIEGIYTHFASADEEDPSFTEHQFSSFLNFCNALEERGLKIPIKHVCNSAATIKYPHMHLNMVRTGIMLYGLNPAQNIDENKIYLKPAMEFKASIACIKTIPKGTPVSYGRIYVTEKDTKIATVSIGYADGFSRILTGKASMIAGDKLVPIVGRICMDFCMLDVTDVSDINISDEVIVFGKRGNLSIFVDNIAENIGTINYEVVSVIGKRVPRVYIRGGNIVNVLNYLV